MADQPATTIPAAAPTDLSAASWIEYESLAKKWVKRIDNPAWLVVADGKPHQVVDKEGVVHVFPGWDTPILVRYKPLDPTKLLAF